MSDSLLSNLVQVKHNQKKKFNERYEIVRRIGTGSMGNVCLVRLKEKSIGGSAFDPDGEKLKIGGLTFNFPNKKKISKIKKALSCKPNLNDVVAERSSDSESSNTSSITCAKDLPDTERRNNEIIYALKSIPLTKLADEYLLSELKNEIDILKSMDHPNIVKAHEVYYHKNEQIFLVMECCSGGDLTTRAPYSEITAKRISRQLLSAVKYMHDHGIVHRDLKCENIMFETEHEDAAIKVIDFGLSRKFQFSQSSKNGKTVMTNYCGSLYTMAPQVVANEGYTSKADLWSCGVIIYMLLVCLKPFEQRARKLLELQITSGKYYNIDGKCEHDEYNKAWSTISEEAKDLVKKLLVVKESERLNANEALNHKWHTFDEGTINSTTSGEIEHTTKTSFSSYPLTPKTITGQERQVSDRMFKNVADCLLHYRNAPALKRVALNVIAHISTTEEIVHLRDVFASYDSDQDGIISIGELKSALDTCEFSHETIREIYHSIDVNENGHIVYTEFLAAALEAQGQVEEERIAEAFNVIDSNNKGYIQFEDLSHLLGRSKRLETEIKSVLNGSEEKGGERISYAMFLQLFREAPKTASNASSLEINQYNGTEEKKDERDF